MTNLNTEMDALLGFGVDAEGCELISLLVDNLSFMHKGKLSIAVYQWGRDCDQFEASNVFIIRADVKEYLKREQAMYENREGPCCMRIISEQEYKEFEPIRRDHRAEQYNY
jgi:hypothetical protein